MKMPAFFLKLTLSIACTPLARSILVEFADPVDHGVDDKYISRTQGDVYKHLIPENEHKRCKACRKCEQPRSKFEMRQRDFVHALPRETAGGMSLLDLSQEKVMQINALRRNDLKASNSELEAKKEQIDAEFSLNNNKPRAAAKRNDELEPTDIKLPEEGVLPDKFELYYASPDRDRAILINGGKTDSYIFSSSSQAGNVVTVTIGMPKEDEEGWVFEDEGSKPAYFSL